MTKRIFILFFFIVITVYAEEKSTVMHGGTTNRIPISETFARMINDPCDYISDADITVLTRQKAASKPKKKAGDSPPASASSSGNMYNFQLTGRFAITNENPPKTGVQLFLYGSNVSTNDEDLGNVLYEDTFITASDDGDVSIERLVNASGYDCYELICSNVTWDAAREKWKDHSVSSVKKGETAPYNGIWERTGEVLSDKAVLHTLLTQNPTPSVKGVEGSVQFIVYDDDDNIVKESEFINAVKDTKYNCRWTVTGLEPGKKYHYNVKTKAALTSAERTLSHLTYFTTVPTNEDASTKFTVITGMMMAFRDEKDKKDGHRIFKHMLNVEDRKPDFIVLTGDTVYYDNEDLGCSKWKYWSKTYKLKNQREFFSQVPGYWQVDDHDYWANNINKPKAKGWKIFRNVNPTPGKSGTIGQNADNYYKSNPYGTSDGDGEKYWRTIKRGKYLQIWIEEGHHYREKFKENGVKKWKIWNDVQREWLAKSINNSDASFKLLITTTPVVGPSKLHGNSGQDKHSGTKFRAEVIKFLDAVKSVTNFHIVCGDRHWKYHSRFFSNQYQHIHEFCCGATANGHVSSTYDTVGDHGDWSHVLWTGQKHHGGYLCIDVNKETENNAIMKVTWKESRDGSLSTNALKSGSVFKNPYIIRVELVPPNAVDDFLATPHENPNIFYKEENVTLEWTQPADNGGSYVDAYLITCSNSTDYFHSEKIFNSNTKITFDWPDPMLEGTNVFSIKARDHNGNYSAPTYLNVLVDKTPPVINSLIIGDGNLYTNKANVVIHFDVTDKGSGVHYFKCTNSLANLNSSEWLTPYSKDYDYTLTASPVDGANISVCAQFMDVASNISKIVSGSIWFDNVAPNSANISINYNDAWANDSKVRLVYSASGADHVLLHNENITNEYDGSVINRFWNFIEDGVKTAKVEFLENYPANPSVTVSDTIKLDTGKPEIIGLSSSTHSLGERTTNDVLVEFNWSLSDNWWTLYPTETDNIIQTNVAFTIGVPNYYPDFSVNQTTIQYSLTNEADGSWHFTIRAEDAAGNISDVNRFWFVLDRISPLPPFVFSNSHPNSDKAYPNQTVDLSWRVSPLDQPRIEGYSYELNKIEQTIPEEPLNIYTNSLTTNLLNGIYYFHIKAYESNSTVWTAPAHFKIQIDSTVSPEGIIRSGVWY